MFDPRVCPYLHTTYQISCALSSIIISLRQVCQPVMIRQRGILRCVLRTNFGVTNFEDSGPPLGIQGKVTYGETVLPFSSSSMYIFTDGITEIKDPSGSMLGAEGFKSYITKHQKASNDQRLKAIIDDIILSGKIQKDDLTILVVDGK